MMTLEERARHAADAVHDAAAGYQPVGSMADVARRQARTRAFGAAAGGLAIFAALVVGTWMAGTSTERDVAEPVVPTPSPPTTVDAPATTTPPAPPTTVPTTPDDQGPVVPVPQPPSDSEAEEVIAGPTTTTEPPATTTPPATTQPPATSLPPETKPPTTLAADTTPPKLAITSPEDGAVFDEKRVRFKGETEPGATVSVGRYEANLDDSGKWSLVLVLTEGRNRVLFKATDAAGNETSARITVYYEPPPPVTEPPPTDIEFTAFATYGSCAEDPPYDVYYGKAKPGTKVQIFSDYGSGHTYANDDGHWEVKVFFPEAPPGKTFTVTAKDQFGNQKKFEFVSYLDGV